MLIGNQNMLNLLVMQTGGKVSEFSSTFRTSYQYILSLNFRSVLLLLDNSFILRHFREFPFMFLQAQLIRSIPEVLGDTHLRLERPRQRGCLNEPIHRWKYSTRPFVVKTVRILMMQTGNTITGLHQRP